MMTRSVELRVDVSAAVGLDEPAEVAVTVDLPDAGGLPAIPVVCFAKPGGGYSRGYFTLDLPGPGRGAQARWHADRGWVFCSLDHLGGGGSTVLGDPERLDYPTVVAANAAAELEVLRLLAEGSLAADFPAVVDPLRLGLGQSMGGGLTIIQQGRYRSYDGIAILGFSAVHSTVALPSGQRLPMPWLPRDVRLGDGAAAVSQAQMREHEAWKREIAQERARRGATVVTMPAPPPMGWCFYYDDVDPALVRADLDAFPTRKGRTPGWASATLPQPVASWCTEPGAVASEAAAIDVPILVAIGERDVVADPRGELRVYASATSVDFFTCPRMGHLHNVASTRELLWRRIEAWADWVRTASAGVESAPAATPAAVPAARRPARGPMR